jgi:hypothetical protein
MPGIPLMQIPNAPNAGRPALAANLGRLDTPTPVDYRAGMVDTAAMGRAGNLLGQTAEHIQRGARHGVQALEQGKRERVRPEHFGAAMSAGIDAIGQSIGIAGQAVSAFQERMMRAKELVDKSRVDAALMDTVGSFWKEVEEQNIPETEWTPRFFQRVEEVKGRIAELGISQRILPEVEASLVSFSARHGNDVAMKATHRSLEIARGTILNTSARKAMTGDLEGAIGDIHSAYDDGLIDAVTKDRELLKLEMVDRNEKIALVMNEAPHVLEEDLQEALTTGKSKLFPDLQPTEIQKLHRAAQGQRRNTQLAELEALDDRILKGEIMTEESLEEELKKSKVPIGEKDKRSLLASMSQEVRNTPEARAAYHEFYGQLMDEVANYDPQTDENDEQFLTLLRAVREKVEPGEKDWLLSDLKKARNEGRKPSQDVLSGTFSMIRTMEQQNVFGDPKEIFAKNGTIKNWDAYNAMTRKAVELRGQMRQFMDKNPRATETEAFEELQRLIGPEAGVNAAEALLNPNGTQPKGRNPAGQKRQPAFRQQPTQVTPDAVDQLLNPTGATGQPSASTNTDMKSIGEFIVWEEASSARRDRNGNLKVYPIPSGDGGGTFEVAGINDRFHGPMAKRLRQMLKDGKFDDAEKEAARYIEGYTKKSPAVRYAQNEGVRLALADTAFNRGPTGAVRTLQRALGVKVDGRMGPVTKTALAEAEKNPQQFLQDFRDAREWYEKTYAKRQPGNKFWNGLVNRWNNQLQESLRRA